MSRLLRMTVALYVPMKVGETQEEAEDRALEEIEDDGMEIYSWQDVEVINVPEEKGGQKR